MDDLLSIAMLQQRETFALAVAVPPAARDRVVSEYVVWLLERALPLLVKPDERELADRALALHRRRAAGEELDPTTFANDQEAALFGLKLWPAEWLGANTMPMTSALARSVLTTSLAIARRQPDSSPEQRQATHRAIAEHLQTLCRAHQAPSAL